MSVAGSQQQTFLRLLAALRPHWRTDAALPARIQALLARHKEFGSRDRRLYRELIYTAVRYLPWIEPLLDPTPEHAAQVVAWLAADTKATHAYRTAVCGGWPAAGSLADRAAYLGASPEALLPSWVRFECPALLAARELEAQLARAPLWLRLQTDDASGVAAEFAARSWRWQPADVLPTAWRMLDEADVTQADSFQRGAFEVQDLGSQLILAAVGIAPGGRWLDACAGAGGKTLQLARLLGPAGHVDAHDVRAAALEELLLRARRARGDGGGPDARGSRTVAASARRAHSERSVSGIPGSATIAVRSPDAGIPRASYDGVLVDAPCSGSGTWRRSPQLKWTTSEAILRQRAVLQARLLDQFAAAVRPGGRLVYATCSIARTENDAVVAAFLEAHPQFEPAQLANPFGFSATQVGLTILSARWDTDGFFVGSLRRKT